MKCIVLLLTMCLVTNTVFASSYAQSDEFRFVNLNDSYLLGEEFSIVFKKMTRQPCPSYEVILMKEGIPESKITYGRQPLCAISGLVEPYLFSGTFEKLEFFDSIGTYSIKVMLDDKTIDKKIKIIDPEYYSILPPLKQFKSGVPLDEILCSEHLVLIQKYDGTPVCVKEKSISKLIERGWSERTSKTILEKLDPMSELNSESSLQIQVVKQFTKPQKIMVVVGDKPSHGKILQISTTEITKIAPTQDEITVWAFQPFTKTNEVDWGFADKHIFDIVDENGRDVIDRMMLPEHYVWDDISRTYPLVCDYIGKVVAESRVPLPVPIKNNASEIFATYSNIEILPDKQGLYTLEFASLYEQEITLPDNADISSSNHNICFLESDPSVTAYYDKVIFSIIDK